MYTQLSLRKITKSCQILCQAMTSTVEELSLFAMEIGDYKVGNEPPEGEYLPFTTVDGLSKRYFIKCDFKTPCKQENCDYFIKVNTGVSGWDALNPQAILYLNGENVGGLDVNHRLVPLKSDTEYKCVTYLYSGEEVARFDVSMRIVKINRRVEKLYYDLIVPHDACRDVYPEGSTEYATTLAILDRCVNLLDLRTPWGDEFLESVERALAFIEQEYYEKLCTTEGKPVVNCVGHTHIDVEWQWDRRQTREKMQRSTATVLSLMEQYPDYIFMLSQPELYRYLKEEAPDLYEKVKARIAEGRWEPEGALYLECDANVPSGESFVRQLMYGKKFFRDEFGRESRVCFLPDVFGYSAALPQILKKADVDYFVTSKIGWNDTNTMPHDAFIWQGIDGSEIPVSFITGYAYDKTKPIPRTVTYVGKNTPAFIKGTWERFSEKSYTSQTLNTYGFGDGGGGPTREMLEYAARLTKGLPGLPVARLTTLTAHLDAMTAEFCESAKQLRRTPRHVGELYLEYHRGTYTTMADNKRDNRKSELSLCALESQIALDLYRGGTFDEKEELATCWRDVLHNQFHDILPGSSIESVYRFTGQDYLRILSFVRDARKKRLENLAKRIDTEGGVLVYNDLGFARRGGIRSAQGYVTTEEIPAFGYKVVTPEKPICTVRIDGLKAENDYYCVHFNQAGHITYLYDKKQERNLVKDGGCMNCFEVYEDYPVKYDAWEMEEYVQTKTYPLNTDAVVTPVFDGERAGFKIERTYKSSRIEELVLLYSNSPRIDLVCELDWHEKKHLLKLAFPTSILSSKLSCDIQFGHLERPTHRNTSWDEARFEVCAHKWVDISEHSGGLAFLSESKYGVSAEGSTVKLTCLKCPDYPNPHADEGRHTFAYSLIGHTGDFCEGDIIRQAHDFNRPMQYLSVPKQNGSLPDSFSLVGTDDRRVVVESLKPAEDGRGVIVRLYESFGGTAKTTLTLADGFTKATLTNLLERDLAPVPICDGKLDLALHPFEIVTLRLEW